jgi:hypothetical protein
MVVKNTTRELCYQTAGPTKENRLPQGWESNQCMQLHHPLDYLKNTQN